MQFRDVVTHFKYRNVKDSAVTVRPSPQRGAGLGSRADREVLGPPGGSALPGLSSTVLLPQGPRPPQGSAPRGPALAGPPGTGGHLALLPGRRGSLYTQTRPAVRRGGRWRAGSPTFLASWEGSQDLR